MSMKKQDYERISGAIWDARERALNELERDGHSAVVHDWVDQFATDLALLLAQGFYSVNERFRAEQFLRDALGDEQGSLAFQEFQTSQDKRKRAQQS